MTFVGYADCATGYLCGSMRDRVTTSKPTFPMIPYMTPVLPHLARGPQPVNSLARTLNFPTADTLRISAKVDERFHVFMQGNAWWAGLASCVPNPSDTVAKPSPLTPQSKDMHIMELTINLLDAADRQAARDLLSDMDKKSTAKAADKPVSLSNPVPPRNIPVGATMDNPAGVPASTPATPAAKVEAGKTEAPAQVKVETNATKAAAPKTSAPVPAIGVQDARETLQQLFKLVGQDKGKPIVKEALQMHGATQISGIPAEHLPGFINHMRAKIREHTPAPTVAAEPAPATEVDMMG